MPMLRKILNATVESPTLPLTSEALIEYINPGQRSSAGVSVNETSSLGMSAVYRAVNLIASTGAGLPLKAYKDDDNDIRIPVTSGSAAAQLLKKPHPDLTKFEWLEVLYSHLCLWGNAYLRKLRNQNDKIVELWPIHPGRVRAGRDSETGIKVYQIDGTDVKYTDREILHIPGFGYDGICGVSPIRFARQAIGLGLAAEEFGAQLFGNGSLASGILQTEQRLERADAERLKERWKDRANGLHNAYDVVVLDKGAKFQQLSIPPEDAQFIESRRFQVTEIARMYGVPPHMLMETDKSTSWGSGIEQQGIGFVVYTMRPWLIRVEQRITQILEPEPVHASYNVEGLLRGDSVQRATFYKSMFDMGVLSTNDIRRLENQPPVDGGDVRFRPLNMGILGESDTTALQNARDLAEVVQKVYLGVGPVLTSDEARDIVSSATDMTLGPMPAQEVTEDA